MKFNIDEYYYWIISRKLHSQVVLWTNAGIVCLIAADAASAAYFQLGVPDSDKDCFGRDPVPQTCITVGRPPALAPARSETSSPLARVRARRRRRRLRAGAAATGRPAPATAGRFRAAGSRAACR